MEHSTIVKGVCEAFGVSIPKDRTRVPNLTSLFDEKLGIFKKQQRTQAEMPNPSILYEKLQKLMATPEYSMLWKCAGFC